MDLQRQQGGDGASPICGPGEALPLPDRGPGRLERAVRRLPGAAGLLDALDRRAQEHAAFNERLAGRAWVNV